MGGKIDCYIDIASYYSYIAFADLRSKRAALAAHGVRVEFHPVLIAGIMNGSGNRPPWVLPSKGRYLTLDAHRSAARVGLVGRDNGDGHTDVAVAPAFPNDFASRSLTVAPLRALLLAKRRWAVREAGARAEPESDREMATGEETAFEALVAELFREFWTPPHTDVAKLEVLERVLREVRLPGLPGPSSPSAGSGGCERRGIESKEVEDNGEGGGARQKTKRALEDAEVRDLMAAARGEDEMKALLRSETDRVVTGLGAFGLPWWWVTRKKGGEGKGGGDGEKKETESEPFFGSDRFYDVCEFLGVPCRDVEIVLSPGCRQEGVSGKSKL